MKQACKSIKSGKVFYIESSDESTATLRNPMTGEVKTIKGTTLKRSYTLLSTEELKMENTMEMTVAPAEVAISYTELFDCDVKADFEEKLEEYATTEGFEDIDACDDYELAKKAYGNASLCFRENMTRFNKAKEEFAEVKASKDAYPEDLDIAKSFQVVETSLQKYTDKMVKYLGKAKAAKAKMTELAPQPEDEVVE